MNMKIAICDDCREETLSLEKLLGEHETGIYTDGESLLADIREKKIYYDLYLLDIFFGQSAEGISLAEEIRRAQDEAAICFISTSEDFYREAYNLYAVQYLVKPVEREALERLLKRVSKSLGTGREQKLSFQSRGHSGSIPYGKILYISSREHTVSICCTDGVVQECRGRLGEMAARVCGPVFMRCHQSFIVNMYHVECLSGTELTVGGLQIPVSRRYYAEVKKRYQEILFEEVE